MQRRSDENGEIMVESTIVFIITLMVVFSLMNFAFMSYQKANLSVQANHAATEIANVYAIREADPFLGYVDEKRIEQKKLYRYIGAVGRTSLDKEQAEKAKWYVAYLLEATEYLHPKRTDGSRGYRDDIEVSVIKNDFGFRQIKVDVKREYSVLSAFPFQFLGLDAAYTARATGYAQCYDMIDYINTEHTVVEVKKRLNKMWQDNAVGDLLENGAGLINNIMDTFNTCADEE